MKDQIFISDSVLESLEEAAKQAQAHLEKEEGAHYPIADLKKIFIAWLETSIEDLATDAMYHVFHKTPNALNSSFFQSKLNKLTPAYDPQEADEQQEQIAA